MERIILISGIWDSGLEDELGFTVESVHNAWGGDVKRRGNWKLVLSSKAGRIYFLERIVALINTLDMDIACYTDINYPGCIVLN